LLKKYLNESVPKVTPGRVEISGFLLEKGDYQTDIGEIFHLTDTFKSHLKDLLRAIAGTELPVLLEGPTSAGKTSMIRHVAETVGYKCIRINNHEHTEIEEYIGNYFPDKAGKLVFREGPLVTAVREGYWLILDELNLAKT
jgi:midasin